jgi:hypothetical protein
MLVTLGLVVLDVLSFRQAGVAAAAAPPLHGPACTAAAAACAGARKSSSGDCLVCCSAHQVRAAEHASRLRVLADRTSIVSVLASCESVLAR